MNTSAIDQIVFGSPCARDREIMRQETYLDRLFKDLKEFTPPKNSSNATKSELKTLVAATNTERVYQNNIYDEGLIPYIKEIFEKAGGSQEYIDEVTADIVTDVIPLITRLKYFFNRPRPAQLACYFKDIELYPDFSYFTNNPSYPSGHTTLTAVTCEVIGNHYPEGYQRMQQLISAVASSRLYLGVHYPSDNDMAMLVAQRILKNPEFIGKYKL